ncbi:type VI secretion system baseplate subunit TssE [Geomonas sp. RF6]|uniref:type VI secretion system baseplate subunit TssE n=1 Tax=Geomonas sp. RF6 TaxID=2897342 RepID=UPI001E4352EA|nr:type VI secretion system baseplate subunit TssE [Geomonas sp. RF6]UFS70715.1 type VI secretion system baseplate subunit TssE [Geomonas sp. RF6]
MQPSLLDRLIDFEPGNPREPVQYRQMGYSEMRKVVARDLEYLLNTKCFHTELPEGCRELSNSLLVYGLPDFTSKNPASPAVRAELRQEMEKAIALFEPRLRHVTVQLDETGESSRELRFKISALLVIDEDAEPVSFDTLFDINRGEYLVPK